MAGERGESNDSRYADDPGDRGTRAERKAQSRRQILDSARDVFFRDGFMTANLDEVAERAGVAKGTLYRYFESKADLYVAVLADNADAFTTRLRESTEGQQRAIDRVLRMSEFYYQYWIRHPEYFQIFWAIDNQSVIGELPSSVVEAVSSLWEQNLAFLDALLEQSVVEGDLRSCNCWELANILWTTANALIQSDATRPRRELRRMPLDGIYHDAIRYILQGLAAPGSRLLD